MSVITNKIKTKHGTIYKRTGSNCWQVYTLIKGRPYRKSTGISCSSDPEALLALDVLNNIVKMNYYVTKKNKSVTSLAKDFLKTLAQINDQVYNTITLYPAIDKYLDNLSNNAHGTYLLYRGTLNEFRSFIGSDKELDQISVSDIENFRSNLVMKNLNPNTIKLKVSFLNVFFNKLNLDGLITENPCKRLPKLAIREDHVNQIRPFTDRELTILLSHVKGSFWETAILIGLFTGARLETVFNIKWGDIDLINNTISIYEKKNKKHIIHNLHPQLRDHLVRLSNVKVINNNDKVVSTEIIRHSQVFMRILKHLKLNTSEKTAPRGRRNRQPLCFHSLRHNYSTRLAENPAISSETRLALVGHSSLDMNTKYNQISSAEKEKATNSLPFIEY